MQFTVNFRRVSGNIGSLISEAQFYLGANNKSAFVKFFYYPAKTKDGFADLRYKPYVSDFPFARFVRELSVIRDYGHFADWDKEDYVSEKSPSPLIQLEGPTKCREKCYIKAGALYWDSWPHSPAYKRAEFDGFSQAVDVLCDVLRDLKSRA